MPKVDTKRSGRVAFDSRGQAVWEWQLATGVFGQDIDTQSLRVLEVQSDLTLADPVPAQTDQRNRRESAIGNPLDQAASQPGETKPARKSLDDLRRLSEEIKGARQWPPARKP